MIRAPEIIVPQFSRLDRFWNVDGQELVVNYKRLSQFTQKTFFVIFDETN